MDQRVTIDISIHSLVRIVGIALAVWFIFFIRDILLFLLVAILIASTLEPLVARLQRFRIPRPLSVLAVYALFLAIIAAIGTVILPPLAREVRDLSNVLPEVYERFARLLGDTGVLFGAPEAIGGLRAGLLHLGDILTQSAGGFFATTRTLFGSALAVVLVFVVSFYLVVNRSALVGFVRSLTPSGHQAAMVMLVERAQRKLSRWASAQLLLAVVVGVLVYVGLWALGIQYALALALLAGLLEVIPVVGPIVAAIPAVLVGFTESALMGLLVVFLYVIIQQLENNALVPLIMRKAVGLHPLVTIIAVLIGAKLAGFLGLLLAVPVATVVAALFADFIPAGRESDEIPA